MTRPTFEESVDFIDIEIAKRKNLWTLSSIQWMDYDDVAQIIRIHIYDKWHLYDPTKPLGPWLNKVIAHQIKNIVRNIYGNYSRPCLKCCASEGDNLCKIYDIQCADCPLFLTWEKNKKQAKDALGIYERVIAIEALANHTLSNIHRDDYARILQNAVAEMIVNHTKKQRISQEELDKLHEEDEKKEATKEATVQVPAPIVIQRRPTKPEPSIDDLKNKWSVKHSK